jgi:protein-S-isoprenylcysteine O-methyltransferase Ste14
VRPFLLPYALIGVILLGELLARGAKRPDARARDAGSLWVIAALTGAGYWGAFAFRGWSLGRPAWRAAHAGLFLGPWAGWAGAALTVAGTAFRVYAVKVLGENFTRVVRVSKDQRLVEDGPYRLIRHPSYTGGLLGAFGVALALGTWPGVWMMLAGALPSYGYRMRVEEEALVEALGEPYRAYRARTKRLIPFVW